MTGFYDVQIAAAEAAESALAEHRRLAELADGLNDLREKKRKAEELDALYDALCQTQADLRANVQEALTSIPSWRQRFAAAHQALLSVAGESDKAQAALLLAGDCLVRAYRIERTIQGLQGQGERGSSVQKMWQSAGGESQDLDPLKGLPGDWWAEYFKGKFLYRPHIGLRHFFRG